MDWTLEKRKLSDLKQHKNNPRCLSKNDAEQLQKSLEKFGVCEPIVINRDNVIVGGHQRVRTLKKMGSKTVDVYVPSTLLDDKEVDELCIRLNRNHGEFDFDLLANNWEPEELLNWGFLPDELSWTAIDEDVKPEEEQEEHKCPLCGKKSKKEL